MEWLVLSLLVAAVAGVALLPGPGAAPMAGDANSWHAVDGIRGSSNDPINVTGNEELGAVATSGNGTLENPYVIENLVIVAGEHGPAILIQDTDAHLIIRNCTLSGTRGIQLSSCTNVHVTGNDLSHGGVGYYSWNSSNNTVSGNIVSNNRWDGILLRASSNITVSGNDVTDNGSDGIHLIELSNSTVSGNTVSGHVQTGILMTDCQHMVVSGNTATGNDRHGISVSGSGNTVSGNTAAGNGIDGISVSGSGNTVSGNTATGNDSVGISMSGSGNTVSGNTATSNDWHGIRLWRVNNSKISGNTASNNGEYGIWMWSSSNNTVSGNILHYNSRGCIRDDGTGNVLIDNDCVSPPPISGYVPWLLAVAMIVAVAGIVPAGRWVRKGNSPRA